MIHDGNCHCGNVRYALRTATPLQDVTLRVCQCEFCLRHRPRYWSDPAGELVISIKDASTIKRYRFGHGTADFVICTGCGVFCFAIAGNDNDDVGDYCAVTNLNLALDKDVRPKEVFLEALDENEDERKARRSRNWTPVRSGWPA